MKTVYALLLASSLIAPATWAALPPVGWDKALLAFDDAYWTAYNKCDLKALSTMNTNDLEFYHDVGGVMKGRKLFDKAMANNICGDPSNNVRREAIKSSVHVYPMMSNGLLYGAVIQGGHQFYNTALGRTEERTGTARFTSLFLLKNGVWKLSRVLSYDHAAVQLEPKLSEVKVAPATLDLLAGTYMEDKMVLTVKRAGNHLVVEGGGSTLDIYPTSRNNFAMQQRDIKVMFSVDATAKGQRLVVSERGNVLAEATRYSK